MVSSIKKRHWSRCTVSGYSSTSAWSRELCSMVRDWRERGAGSPDICRCIQHNNSSFCRMKGTRDKPSPSAPLQRGRVLQSLLRASRVRKWGGRRITQRSNSGRARVFHIRWRMLLYRTHCLVYHTMPYSALNAILSTHGWRRLRVEIRQQLRF